MKIGILTGNDTSVYNSLGYFNEQIKEMFIKLGHEARHYNVYENDQMVDMLNNKPDFTIGIGTFYSIFLEMPHFDYLKIPHFAWIIDHPIGCNISYIDSPYLYYLTIDREHSMFFDKLGKKSFFVPLGANISTEQEEKKYDLVFTGHIVNASSIEQQWKQSCDDEAFIVLGDIKKKCIEDMSIPILVQILRYQNEKNYDFNLELQKAIYKEIDGYMRNYKRKIVLQSIKYHNINVFGTVEDEELKSKNNLIFHGNIDYDKTFNIFKNSKIAINITPNYQDGCHDRSIAAIASGAVLLTDENTYMQEHFRNNSVLFYNFNNLEILDNKIEKVLFDLELRRIMVNLAKNIVKDRFTWEYRCKQIIDCAYYAVNYTKWFM